MKLLTIATSTFFAASLAAQELQVALIAVEPIRAVWTNPPPFTTGAVVTHPPGLLNFAHVAAPNGTQWARFDCELTCKADAVEFTAASQLWPPPYAEVMTSADLLLVVWMPADRAVAVMIRARHLGDTPSPTGFTVDVDNDGAIDADTHLNHATRAFFATFLPDQPVRLIRVRNFNTMAQPPQAFDLLVRFDVWHESGTAVTEACPTIGYAPQLFGPELASDYQLALLPSTRLGEAATLIAHGIGPFSQFFVADQSAMVPLILPPPFPGVCDALATAAWFDPGIAIGQSPSGAQDTDWRLAVPPLPPGLTIYVQHASATATQPFCFGTTNVVRIDT